MGPKSVTNAVNGCILAIVGVCICLVLSVSLSKTSPKETAEEQVTVRVTEVIQTISTHEAERIPWVTITPKPTSTSPPSPTPVMGIIHAKALNVRAGPGLEFSVLATVREGQEVPVLGRNQDSSWLLIRTPTGQEGWASAGYIVVESSLDSISLSSLVIRTATPSVSPAESLYAAQVVIIIAEYADSLMTFGELMTRAGTDYTLIFDTKWRVGVGAQLARWRSAGEKVRSLSPPPEMRLIHKELLGVADELDLASVLVAEGIDEFDVDKLSRANQAIFRANQHIERLADLAEKSMQQ